MYTSVVYVYPCRFIPFKKYNKLQFNIPIYAKSKLCCFSADRSNAVPLLQFFFVCASAASYAAYVSLLFVPHLFFF